MTPTLSPGLEPLYRRLRLRDNVDDEERAALQVKFELVADNASMARALTRLARGDLLSAESTEYVLDVMSRTKSGPKRLKAGLPPGWKFLHKTGTGQNLGGMTAGYNDIGILTAPDGSSYTVAVMIKKTATPLPVRMTLMNNVVRAVIESHEARRGAPTL